MTALAVEPAGPGRRAPRPGYLALLWLAATGTLLALAVSQPQRHWTPAAPTEVVLGGEHYRLDAPQLAWLRAFSALHFSEGRAASREVLALELDRGLEEVFAAVRGRLPAFADWYYSLGGEYSRLGMAALTRLNLVDGEFIANRAAAMLFPAEEWESALAGLDRRMLATLEAHQQSVRADWLAQLEDRLAPHRVPAPLDGRRGGARAEPLGLDRFIAGWIEQERHAFAGRLRASTAAGGAAAGAVLWRRAAARAAAASGRAIAARGAGRATATAGSLAVCAATGPAAAGCALLAGAVAWLATDWALLQLDEWRSRDALLAALDAGLEQLRAQMQADVLAAHDALSRELEARAGAVIEREFRPAQAGRQELGPATSPAR